MDNTAKIIPFPSQAPIEAPATKEAPKREPLTWERICEAQVPPRGAPHNHLFDTLNTTGFGAYVTATNHRSYFVECPERQPGTDKWKRVRVKFRDVGKHGKPREGKREVEEARGEAILLLQAAARGEPISKGAKEAAAALAASAKPAGAKTFKQAWLRYREEATGRNGKPLRRGTLRGLDRAFEKLKDWHNVPLFEITRPMVSAMVTTLRKESQEFLSSLKGAPESKHTSADKAMRLLRAVWRFHAAEEENGKLCPTAVLKPQKKWVKTKRRKSQIEESWAREWWVKLAEMTTLTDSYERPWWNLDQLLFFRAAYLVGGRSSEVNFAMWKHIDLEARTWLFPGDVGRDAVGEFQGNKSDRDHIVYMGDELTRLLRAHWKRVKDKGHKFIFTDEAGRAFTKPANAIDQFRKVFPKFPRWSMHDLRRTYLTLTDDEDLNVPMKIKKVLVNHDSEGDVTLGYIQAKADRVRTWAERVQEELLKRVGVN